VLVRGGLLSLADWTPFRKRVRTKDDGGNSVAQFAALCSKFHSVLQS
jgi:hypothetical protein